MGIITRSRARRTTPEAAFGRYEADTVKKSRFFNAYDRDVGTKSLTLIAEDAGTTQPTATRWLKEREEHGRDAYRSSRKKSKKLGRKPSLSKQRLRDLCDPEKNPVRKQLYEAQIAFHSLRVHPRTLQRLLKKWTTRGQRYKCAYVKKQISKVNKGKRVKYGEENKDKPIHGFWDKKVFTDEAHIDPDAQGGEYVLREQPPFGDRYDPRNMQEKPQQRGVMLHVAAWVSWDAKAEKLEFYHDEEDYIEKPKRPRKPRRRKHESEEVWEHRIKEWEATAPHEKEVKTQGNSMTQKYYVERLLPIYVDAVKTLRERDSTHTEEYELQEDGDPSHGLKREGLAQLYKAEHNIRNFVHPPQSPDLNPIEACWNILKQRVRKHVWHDIEELKEILQREWAAITQQEIQSRIAEMPERCKKLIRFSGKPIKSSLW
jgi:hypothetical protein